MPRPIRISLQIPANNHPDYQVARDRVRRAEDSGVDIVFGYDHFTVPVLEKIGQEGHLVAVDPQPDLPNFEPLTALAAWAEQTSRVELGLLVAGVGFRNPDLLADIARTIDHISAKGGAAGRHILGVGSGWYERDYKDYGYEFGSAVSRLDGLEAGLERIVARFAKLNPAPTRKIPILIGGGGEKKTLPLVAKYADIWHYYTGVEELLRKKEVLARHAEAVGRDVGEIELSQQWPGFEAVDAYLEAGVTLFNIQAFHLEDGAFDPDDDFGWVKEVVTWRDKANG